MQVTGDIEVQPVLAGHPCLPTRSVGDRDQQAAAGRKQGDRARHNRSGVGHVLEAVPHRDGVDRRQVAEAREVGLDAQPAAAGACRIQLGPGDVPAPAAGGEQEVPVTAPGVDDGAGTAARRRVEKAQAATDGPPRGEAVPPPVVVGGVVSSEIRGAGDGDAVPAYWTPADREDVVRDGVPDVGQVDCCRRAAHGATQFVRRLERGVGRHQRPEPSLSRLVALVRDALSGDLPREVRRYLVVGVLATLTDIGLFNLLAFPADVAPTVAKTVSTVVAVLLSYTLNRFWTFRHRGGRGYGRELTLYGVINGLSLLASVGSLRLAARFDLEGVLVLNAAAFGAVILVGTVIRFLAYRRWVFPSPVDRSSGGGDDQQPEYEAVVVEERLLVDHVEGQEDQR